ncbi:MAG: shikimate kinase [Bacteroidota bacterium]
MKIALVGYMASGKSSVGQVLSQKLDHGFIDLDNAIEENVGCSISKIFHQKGELFFRKKESEVLISILREKPSFVLSTGGGTPCYGNNMETMLESADQVFYLRLSIPVLVKRLRTEKEKRPLIQSIAEEDLQEFVRKHLFERSPFYFKADHDIFCDGKTVNEIVQDIQAKLL